MYIFQKTEPGIWSVGDFNTDGKWETESEFPTAAEASQRAHFLNGGHNTENTEPD